MEGPDVDLEEEFKTVLALAEQDPYYYDSDPPPTANDALSPSFNSSDLYKSLFDLSTVHRSALSGNNEAGNNRAKSSLGSSRVTKLRKEIIINER